MTRHKRELSIAVAVAAFVMVAGSSAALATIEASMCVIDGDLVITTDGDPGKKMKISKGGDNLTKDKFRGAAGDLGFDGSSHTVKDWSASGPWPPGVYDFKGKDADGVEMTTTATLDDCIPDPPVITDIGGLNTTELDEECVAVEDFVSIEWDEVDEPDCAEIVRYEVHVECEDVDNELWFKIDPDEVLDGGDDPDFFVVLTLGPFEGLPSPWGFDQECWITVKAVGGDEGGDSCNVSSADIHVETCEEETD